MNHDVLVIGGGIIGGSIAFELARHKRRVLLLDRQQPGLESSWAAAGMLTPAPETGTVLELAPLAKASFALYPEFAAAVEEASGLRVGFHCAPALQVFFGEGAKNEQQAALGLLRETGVKGAAIPVEEARRMEPALNPAARAAIRVEGEGFVDNRALTEAVLAAAAARGAELRAGVEVQSIETEKNRCAGVLANGERIPADTVVLAAGCFSGRIAGVERYAPTTPAHGQMVALRHSELRIGHVVRSHAGYVVPRDDGRVVAGSTVESVGFVKRVTPAGLQQVLAAAVELVPELEAAEVVETWSGLRPDTPDHLPILGPTDIEGLFLATGHFRNGILLAPITARLVREWIENKKPSIETEGFSPMRFGKTAAAS